MAEHIVRPGECLASIALDRGIALDTLVKANPDLGELRGEFGILAEGDIVILPDIKEKAVNLAASGSHRIRFRGNTNPVTMRFLTVDGDPRGNEAAVLRIDGVPREQVLTTDGDGRVTFNIPAHAKTGELLLGEPGMRMPVAFGALDPSDTISGAQGRLKHLGFYHGALDGVLGPKTHEALRALQLDEGSDPVADIDDPDTISPELLEIILRRSGA